MTPQLSKDLEPIIRLNMEGGGQLIVHGQKLCRKFLDEYAAKKVREARSEEAQLWAHSIVPSFREYTFDERVKKRLAELSSKEDK